MAQFANTIGSLPIQAGTPANWTKQNGQVDISVVANNETQYSDRAIAFANMVASCTLTWNVPGVLGDSESLALMKFTGPAQSGVYYFSSGIRLQASADTGYYLGFIPNNSGGGASIRLAQIDNGQVTTELQTVSFTWTNETWYWIRLRATGTSLQAKVWTIGSAEPGAFQINTSDSTYATGRLGVRCRSNSITPLVANFWAASAGETAVKGNTLQASAKLAISSVSQAYPFGIKWGTNKVSLKPTSDINARFVGPKQNISAVFAAALSLNAVGRSPTRWDGGWTAAVDSTIKVQAYIPYKTLPKTYPGDRYHRRFEESYAEGYNDLLPTGPAWPRDPDTTFQKAVAGLSAFWGSTVEKLAQLLLVQESDPRSTVVLLPEWERAWGLPDKCLAEPLTIVDRQIALVHKITLLGAQSRDFFVGVAKSIGYDITIREWAPFMCGVSMAGDTRGTDLISGSVISQPSSAKPNNRLWVPNGAAQIDVAQFKFGTGSLLLNPASLDMISSANHPDWFLTNQNFTIQGFFNCTQAANLTHRAIIGQSSADLSSRAFSVCRTPSTGDTVANVIKAELFTNNGQQAVFGTTVFTNALNTGWHHWRFVRFLNTLYLFIDGLLEGTLVMPAGTIVNSIEQPLAIGGFGNSSGANINNTWGGWLDAVQFEVGEVDSISNFAVPDAEPIPTEFTRALLNFNGVDGSKVFFDESLSTPVGEILSPLITVNQNPDERAHYRWEIGKPEMRFFWSVRVGATRYTWFRASSGQAGVNHHLEFALATDLECILRRWKPAHTEIIFDYSPMVALDFSKSYDNSYYMLIF